MERGASARITAFTSGSDRLNYIRWDADRFSFHESNLEHIRATAGPRSRWEDSSLLAATVGQEDIKWVPTGDHMRMGWSGSSTVCLSRCWNEPTNSAEYENGLDFPVREEFHLNPAWADLARNYAGARRRTPDPSLVPPDAVRSAVQLGGRRKACR